MAILVLLLSLLAGFHSLVASASGAGHMYTDSVLPYLPTLLAEGTHYEVGWQIGSTFKKQILFAMENNTFFNEKMIPYNQSTEGANLYTSYLHSAKIFPQYIDEIRGMADGIEMPFEKLFLWNLQFEWQLILESRTGHLPSPSCSDLLLKQGDMMVLGHNEDSSPLDASTTYLVHAKVQDDNGTEEFWAFCHPGELCGNAFGFNTAKKIATSVNSVFPKDINTKTVASNFINRAMLSSSLEEARELFKTVPCSSGFSANIGSLDTLELSNFEVYASGFVETKVQGYSYHFNMYIHAQNVSQHNDPSSVHRLARVKELPSPQNASDILHILGDTEDQQYPIYRTAVPPDDAMTIATVLFDFDQRTLSIFRGNPGKTNPLAVLSMHT